MFITAVRVERDLGVPSVSLNALTGHRSCAPEDCSERPSISRRGQRRLQASFRRAFTCAFWRLGFRQSGFRHITRISRCATPDAWTWPPVSWHAIFPCILSDSGKPSDPEISPLISARCAGDTTVRLMAHTVCKPSAQPTLVRTQHLPQHLPPPANMPASWIFLASGLFRLFAKVCRLVTVRAVVSRDPRTYGGRRACP